MFVDSNSAITAISGFNALETINGNLLITNNASLKRIEGFASLVSVGGNLLIDRNQQLETAAGFDRLESVVGDWSASGNDLLSVITGFRAPAQRWKFKYCVQREPSRHRCAGAGYASWRQFLARAE